VCVALAALSFGFAPEAARRADIVTARTPPEDGSYYVASDRGGEVDHHVLYHGTDAESLARLRAADVLFLGNSRLMFALERETLGRFFQERGLTYYVLGFGHREQDDFPERIIERFDLRPRYVVANVDGFFWDGHSDWAERVVRETSFDAWKLQAEAEAAHWVRRRLHAIVPHYVDLQWGHPEIVIYRSRLDGTWFVGNQFAISAPFVWPEDDRHVASERSLAAAESFKANMDRRGTRLVLCLVPAPQVSIHRARLVAKHLGVPLALPEVTAMRTVDGSHLTDDSARRFLSALLEELAPLLAQQSTAGLR
jgi:hypothetical protein